MGRRNDIKCNCWLELFAAMEGKTTGTPEQPSESNSGHAMEGTASREANSIGSNSLSDSMVANSTSLDTPMSCPASHEIVNRSVSGPTATENFNAPSVAIPSTESHNSPGSSSDLSGTPVLSETVVNSTANKDGSQSGIATVTVPTAAPSTADPEAPGPATTVDDTHAITAAPTAQTPAPQTEEAPLLATDTLETPNALTATHTTQQTDEAPLLTTTALETSNAITGTSLQTPGPQTARRSGLERKLNYLEIDMLTSPGPENEAASGSRYSLRPSRRDGIGNTSSTTRTPKTPAKNPRTTTKTNRRKRDEVEVENKDEGDRRAKKTKITNIVLIIGGVRREKDKNPTWKWACCPHDDSNTHCESGQEN